jgi:hypothetical protein
MIPEIEKLITYLSTRKIPAVHLFHLLILVSQEEHGAQTERSRAYRQRALEQLQDPEVRFATDQSQDYHYRDYWVRKLSLNTKGSDTVTH